MAPYLIKFQALLLITISLNSWAIDYPYSSKDAHKGVVEFAPGIISTKNNFEINAVFNKKGDKVIFARCNKEFTKCTMRQSRYINKQWQASEVLPFSGSYLDADPYYNEDYSALYFISKRPIKASTKATKSLNFWKVRVQEKGWGKPQYLADLSSDADDLYPSFNSAGDFYFPSFRNNKRLLYVAKSTRNGFAEPVAIPASVYGKEAKIGDSVISRDGKFIIFSISNRTDSKGRGDLYISHWKNGSWTIAKSLGELVNTPNHEFTPIMSPDGEYLFFTRIENGLGNLYQVHKSLLEWE
ncbi:TolB family protein [Agarilytica rhodophyticola]|uniref:TolB family protein n=1 Tax=Agarilytica rhodophyticola TaxID=1737490 RepID=UPI001319BBCA|nr:PD40 domain-containing protein [Agarilytica rhodophyticola]